MASRPTPAGARGTCPCCGTPDQFLFTCNRCDWEIAPSAARAEAQERLEQFQSGLGKKAFSSRGCQICETCWTQVGACTLACPLRLFYESGLTAEERTITPHRQFGDAVCAQWETWLEERNWPEPNEIHWRRMITHLIHEKEQA
jgi:hypothetical protein